MASKSASNQSTATEAKLLDDGGMALPTEKRRPMKIEFSDKDAEGFVQVNLDIVGFWNEDCIIHCIPKNVKLFDNKVEKAKPSPLITVELIDPIDVRTTEGEIIRAEAGQLVGIWGRAGMRDLKVHADCRVKIAPNGEKELEDQKNAMRLYDIRKVASDTPKVLKVALDKRDKSKRTETFWDEASN